MQTLFDKNGMLNISDLVINNPTFKTIMEDGIVTDEEVKRQSKQQWCRYVSMKRCAVTSNFIHPYRILCYN